MLQRTRRLTATNEIEQVYQQGRRLFHPLIRLVYTRTLHKTSRATVVVSKRVDVRAVERNRLKRIIRSLLQEQLQRQVDNPKDIVIIVQPRARGASRLQLSEAFEYLMKKLNYYV